MRSRAPRAVPVAALAVLLLGTGASCAHQMGKNTSSGFVEGLRESKSSDPEEQALRIGANRVVMGGLEALDDPQQRERFRSLVALVADEAVRSAVGALDEQRQRRLRELVASAADEAVASALSSAAAGEDGVRGPAAELAGEIARAGAQDALREVRAGLGASLSEFFPGCEGRDAETCRRQYLRALTREAGAGFSAGAFESIKWPLLFATGGLGLLVGLLLGLLVHWLRMAGPPRPAGHRPSMPVGGGRGLRVDTRTHGGSTT